GVVLAEVAGWVSQIPEEVGADEMAAQPPDVTLGMTFEHPHGASADLVDIIDLPGRVMEKGHRGWLEQQVVVVGRTPQEGGGASHSVTDFESDTLDKEALRRFGIRGADDDVAQFAG